MVGALWSFICFGGRYCVA